MEQDEVEGLIKYELDPLWGEIEKLTFYMETLSNQIDDIKEQIRELLPPTS
jgi:hypothetical protein